MFQCYQVRVQYVDVDYKNNTTVDEFHESAWIKLSHYENFENEVRFLNQRHKAKYGTMYDFHDSTDTLKFWTEKRASHKTFLFFIRFWWNLAKL